ncbi:hypothetical protein CXB51_024232 [Gossypium anomalum]|uniref:Reverse transcriptase Ty1/copia-type domain-containing protein n=1 Tax=Gossypium anomalum TaxID=47600 RepID=A0A8J5YDE5_9ROSI|nr:hypothetical protein CXB51_024232 [Gossypium anomalum]
MKSQDSALWKEAINDEMDSIMGNQTWILVNLPPGSKPIGCKWIFKKKMKVDGTIDKFKARLVAKGFTQKQCIDYFDTYAPVARIATIRLLISLTSIYNLVVHQMDVKTAFLNRELEEEVYMEQLEGSVVPGQEHKNLGVADVILGIKITRDESTIALSQSNYIENMFKKFYLFNCIPASTPMDPQIKLVSNIGRKIDQLKYASLVGCLMYIMTCTIPNIASVVGKLSRYTSNPSSLHWQALNKVLRYLKKTINYGLCYNGYPPVLEGYSDASWITSLEDHASTSGWIFILGRGVISWGSKKQTCITDSTMTAEFITLAAAFKEEEWLRNLLYDVPLWPKPISPIFIRCDSEATLVKAYSQVYNGKSRHIGLRYSYVLQLIFGGVITINYVRSSENLADPLTKSLARDAVKRTSKGMRLKLIN